jgi:hypothetical protein
MQRLRCGLARHAKLRAWNCNDEDHASCRPELLPGRFQARLLAATGLPWRLPERSHTGW